MKLFYSCIIILSTNFLCYAQIEEIVEETVIESTPLDRGIYKNGLKEDYWVVYRNNNIEKGNYLKGEKNGEWKIYDKFNKIKSLENYNNGIKDGKWKYYDKNQKIQQIRHYKNNKKHGDFIYYFDYDNDLIYSKVNYSNDMKNGKSTSYYESGKIRSSGNYSKGKRNGKWISYYRNGLIKESENYRNDERNGELKRFAENGNILVTGQYLNNKENGEWKSYYSKTEGLLHRRKLYKNGELINSSQYRSDKSIQTKVKVNVSADGINYYIEEYDLNGKIKSCGYKNQKMNKIGFWKIYNESGDILENQEYEDGVLKKNNVSQQRLQTPDDFIRLEQKTDSIDFFIEYKPNISIYDTLFLRVFVKSKFKSTRNKELLKYQGVTINISSEIARGISSKVFTAKSFNTSSEIEELVPDKYNKDDIYWIANLYTKNKNKVQYAPKLHIEPGEKTNLNLLLSSPRLNIKKITIPINVKFTEIIKDNKLVDLFMKYHNKHNNNSSPADFNLERLIYCKQIFNHVPLDSLINLAKNHEIKHQNRCDNIKYNIVSRINDINTEKYDRLVSNGVKSKLSYVRDAILKIINNQRLHDITFDTRNLDKDKETVMKAILSLYDEGKFKGKEDNLIKYLKLSPNLWQESKKEIETRFGKL